MRRAERPASLNGRCLWTHGPSRADVHHPPWTLRPAEVELAENTMAPDGVEPDGEPLWHYAERQDVVVWSLEPG